MLTSLEREVLRQKALADWGKAKRLRRDAALVHHQSLVLRHSHRRTEATAPGLDGPGPVACVSAPPDGPLDLAWGVFGPTMLETLADRVIDAAARHVGHVDPVGGAGMVAAGDLGQLVRVKDMLGRHLPLVVGANDAGTALGVAILSQPDLAVVDADLELASGAELAMTLSFYAPRTKVLVLTDDAEVASKVRLAGLDTLSRNISDSDLFAWMAVEI